MKKITLAIAIILSLTLLCACAAPIAAPAAEPSTAPAVSDSPSVDPTASQATVPETPAPIEPSSEQHVLGNDARIIRKLNLMMPIFDSIVRSISVEGNAYDSLNNEYFWDVLYLMGNNWSGTDPLVTVEEDRILVPRQLMQEYASAAFSDYQDLLLIPENLAGSAITYDDGMDGYYLSASDMGDTFTQLDGYYMEPDGSITAIVGMYSFDEGLISTTTLPLCDNAYVDGITDPTYLYSVKSANTVSASAKLWQQFEGENIEYTAADGMEVKITVASDEDAYTTTIDFSVNGNNQQQIIESYLYNMSCHISDVSDTDGYIDFYISGDEASDDYHTYIYHMDATGIAVNDVFGNVDALDSNGNMLVSTHVDVLGTYGAYVVYTRTSNLTLELISDYSIASYEEALNSRPLMLLKDGFTVMIEHADGSLEDATIDSGVKLTPYETDGESYCRLLLEDGRRAYIDIDPDTEDWGWLINGVSERDWFGELPYAG